MHWLALHCPALALEIFTEEPGHAPLAIIEPAEGHERVVACNTAAEGAGIRSRMGRSAAHARIPELHLIARDRAAERHALSQIAVICLGYSDHVALDPPDGVLLEVGASRRLFGGFDRLLRDLAEALARGGWTAVYGLAPTPAAARLLAGQGGGRIEDPSQLTPALDALPWENPALDRTSADRLKGWGIRTLGECRALPRVGVAERLGPGFGAWLDRLYGHRSESVPRHEPPSRFEGMLPLPSETAELTLPLLALERLTRECEIWLRARDAGLERFGVDLYPPRGARHSVYIGLANPGRNAGHLLALARERLEGVELPEAISAVGLRGGRPLTYAPGSEELWAQHRRPDGAAAEPPQHLLERLRARLGFEAVHGLSLQAEHRPERAWAWSAPGAIPSHEPDRPPSRPLWLLPKPASLSLDERGRPHCEGELELLDGPERIETGWWDGDDVERDYFVARTPTGSMLWIYRERRAPQRWFAHGLFG